MYAVGDFLIIDAGPMVSIRLATLLLHTHLVGMAVIGNDLCIGYL